MRHLYCRTMLRIRELADHTEITRLACLLIGAALGLGIGIAITEFSGSENPMIVISVTLILYVIFGIMVLYFPSDDWLRVVASARAPSAGQIGKGRLTVVNTTAYPTRCKLYGVTEGDLEIPPKDDASFSGVASGRVFLRFCFELSGEPLFCQSRAFIVPENTPLVVTVDRLLGGEWNLVVIEPGDFEVQKPIPNVPDFSFLETVNA